MANVKFSGFASQSSIDDADELVGLHGGVNSRWTGSVAKTSLVTSAAISAALHTADDTTKLVGDVVLQLGPDTTAPSGYVDTDGAIEIARNAALQKYVYEIYIQSAVGDIADSYGDGIYVSMASQDGGTQDIS